MAKGRDLDDDDEEEFEDGDDIHDAEADGASDEEEEDEEEGQDEYEKDGFIVDEDEDDEVEEEDEARESSDEEAKARKKKRKKRNDENDELDEDDYELLREHNVTGFHRPPPKSGSKTKFKRLKKAGKGGGDDDRGSRRGLSDDEEEEEEGSRRGRSAEEELKRTLFGDDEGVPPDDVGEEEEPEEEEEIGEEDDEMADFIVDEEEGEDDGQPFRRKKGKKKKRNPRQAPGISSFALQEAQDIFGDVSALLDQRRQRDLETQKAEMDGEEDDGSGRRKPSKLLEKQFEPSLLEEKFMTEKDDHIRDTDVPERIQLLEELVGSFPTSDHATREAQWIYERAFGKNAFLKSPEFGKISVMEKERIIKQIANVLLLVHEEKLELPFIAMYRKEKCVDLLQESTDVGKDSTGDERPVLKRYEALWAVHHWDKKWLLLKRRKTGLEAAFEKRNLYELRKGNAKGELFRKLLQALSEAQSEQTVDDVDAKFNLHFPPDEVDVEPGQFKRPKRRSLYSLCRKAGLGAVASHFGLTPEKFGENISAMYKRHEVEDEEKDPEDFAKRHLAGEFQDTKSVLKGAAHMASVEISTEPAVREYVRQHFMTKAVVRTQPTQEGNTIIDSFHQYAPVKWLKNKPVERFDDGQWLLIEKAEDEKLLEVTIALPETFIHKTLMAEFEAHYLSENLSRTAKLWNVERKRILEDALQNMILPAMEKEVRLILTSRAKQWVAGQCSNALWDKVSVAPWTSDPKSPEDDTDYDGSAPRVVACCWGSGKPATTFVMLGAAGEVINVLYTGYLTNKTRGNEVDPRKEQDRTRLLEFLMDHQPHVVVLGAANLDCRYLRNGIFEVIFKIMEEHPRRLAEGLDTIGFDYGDETIAQLYENSRISEEQLVGQPGIVRRAVALGRYLQNPLAMVATLCGPGKDVLSLKLHALQSFLDPDDVYESVERVMVTVTNQVGVDVNLAASHDWLFAPLQFVSGLGPRKASYIQRSIQGAGRISTRRDLLASLRLMGRKVFINAAGFIRVRGTGQASTSNQIMDPLDDTRIHPESYELAKRVADYAYCEELGRRVEDMDEDSLELAIEHVKRHPDILETMNMEAYVSVMTNKASMNGLQTLKMIKMELIHGFQEWRARYKKLSVDEEFYLLSGANEDTLAEGCIVHAKVIEIQQSRVRCLLESGLTGFIRLNDLSDESNVDPNAKVVKDAVVTCPVKGVNKAKFQVDLTCKGSALRNEHWGSRRIKDPFYSLDLSLLRIEAKKRTEEDKRVSFNRRMIVHPQFQNVSLLDATQALSEKDIGEVVIRPSSKGPSHLSMTLKFFDGVYANIDIVEGGKDSKDATSFLRLGKTLTIRDETFEDLDEVIARYVDPLVSHLKEVFRHRKFKSELKAELDQILRDEKKKEPGRIPYYISISHEHPGALMLSYIKSVSTVSHEYISVSPKGLKFRNRLFDSTDKLISYFQKHFTDPLPDVAPRRAVASMVPPRSPAPSAGGSYYKSRQWGSARSGEGATSTGWDSVNSWDRSGGRGRSSGSWGRGGGASTSWDRQPQGGPNSGGSWAPGGPSAHGGVGWNGGFGAATGNYTGGRGAFGPPAGQNNWDKSQQGQRGGFKSGANVSGHETGFSDVPSLTPLSESSWGSWKTPAGGSSAAESGWGVSQSDNWDSSDVAKGKPHGESTDNLSQGQQSSGWNHPMNSKDAGSWGRDSTDNISQGQQNSGWDHPMTSKDTGSWGRDSTDKISQGQQSSGWDPSVTSKDSGSWGRDSTDNISQGQQSSGWDHPMASKDTGSSWEKSGEKSTSQRGLDSTEGESEPARRNGWEPQSGAKSFAPNGGERQRADPRRAPSGWDQQVRAPESSNEPAAPGTSTDL